MYVFFYERGLKLLREQGVLTYISSNKYFRAAYGQKLRQFLASRSRIHQIIDFGDALVFTAIAYPTIVIMENVQPHEQQLRALNWEGQPVEQLEAVVQQNSFWMPQQELKAQGWQLAGDESLRLLERLRKAGTPLGDYVNGRFHYGIKTGFNEAFVVDRVTRDRLIAKHPSSEEVLKPFLRGRDVKRWRVEYQNLWLVFTRQGIDIEKYPAIKKHLEGYKESLEKRLNVVRDGDAWYQIPYAISYWQEFDTPKILCQEIATYQAFAWDTSGAFSNNKTFLISRANLYLLALLNSKIVWFFLGSIVGKMAGGTYAMQAIYVSQIPIPNILHEHEKFIECFTSYILELQNYSISAQDKLMLKYFEQLINAIVYELYLPEDLHTHGCIFAQLLQAETLPNLDDIPTNKLEAIRAVCDRLSAPDHPIQQNLLALNTLPVIRLIEGKV